MFKRLCLIMPEKTEIKFNCAERKYVLSKMFNIDENIHVKDQQINFNPNLKLFRHRKTNLNQIMPSGLDSIDSQILDSTFYNISQVILAIRLFITSMIAFIWFCELLRCCTKFFCKCKVPTFKRK